MPHPGRILYSHPPKTDDVRYLCVIFHRGTESCELKAAGMRRQELAIEVHPVDLLDMLEQHDVEGAWWDEEVSLRAARALEDYLARKRYI